MKEIVAAIILRVSLVPLVMGALWLMIGKSKITGSTITNTLLISIALILLSLATKLGVK